MVLEGFLCIFPRSIFDSLFVFFLLIFSLLILQTYLPAMAACVKELLVDSLHDNCASSSSSSAAPSISAPSNNESFIIQCPNPHHSVALTTDGWTGPDHESYICVTAHWLDFDWKMRTILLDVLLCSDRHTGDNLEEWLINELHVYHIYVSHFFSQSQAAAFILVFDFQLLLLLACGCFCHCA